MDPNNKTEIADEIIDAIPTPTVETTPIETPAEQVTETPAEDKPFLHTDTPSLLGKSEGKPADAPAATDTTDVPVESAPEPALEPIKYEFKVPDGVAVDENRISTYTEILNKHNLPAEAAQEFFDLYASEAQDYAQRLEQHAWEESHRAFAETRKEWRGKVMADPEIGGAGHQTAMTQIGRMRDLFVPERDQKEFNDFLDTTGAGDHPAFLRLFYRMGAKFDEGVPAPMPAAPAPQSSKRDQRRKLLYNHPESQS
jgi:hypothetical protein